MSPQQLQLNQSIAEIENIYPADDLIGSYKDFLKQRDYLHFYQYNEAVFVSLIDLTHKLWDTKKRISRASLLAVTKRYFKKAGTKTNIQPNTITQIFELFQQVVYYESLKLSKESLDNTKNAVNSLLIGFALNESQIQWLCNHTSESEHILNRVLRYNYKSKIISDWAITNFEKDYIRCRRSEITSWIIDENPSFKIDRETIKYDFKYQIIQDRKLVEDFKNEMDAYYLIEKELRPLLSSPENSFFDFEGVELFEKIQEKPVLNIPRRLYGYTLGKPNKYGYDIPDFEIITESFYKDFDNHYKRIMAWSIAYSRLSIKQKTDLLEKYYSNDIYNTFFSIGKRLNSVGYFKWLKTMVD